MHPVICSQYFDINMTIWQDNTTMTIQVHVVCQKTDKHIDHCHSPFQAAFCNGTGSIANRLISNWTSCSKTGFLSQGKVPCPKHKMICVRVKKHRKTARIFYESGKLDESGTIHDFFKIYSWIFMILFNSHPQRGANHSNLNAGPSTLRQTPASLFSSPKHQKPVFSSKRSFHTRVKC